MINQHHPDQYFDLCFLLSQQIWSLILLKDLFKILAENSSLYVQVHLDLDAVVVAFKWAVTL